MSSARPNAWSVLRRDVGRLARVSKAWIIIIGVIVTPSLYAWFNIVAFWDPYANTQSVSVAVVNQDEGAFSELTGAIDVGGELVGQLEKNDQLGWTFLDEDEAMDAVRSGRSYAAIIIPPDFSRAFVSITSGDFQRPELTYYVNEKANAIAPKITDVGASTLDDQINSTFVSVVAQAATQQLRDAGADLEDRLGDAQDRSLSTLDDAVSTVTSARERIATLNSGLQGAQQGIDNASSTLTDVDAALAGVQRSIAQAQSIADEAQGELLTLTDEVTSAYVSGAAALADASARMNASIGTLAAGLQQASAAVGTGIDDVTAVVAAADKTLADLQSALDQTDPGSEAASRLRAAIDALQQRTAGDRAVLAQLTQLNGDVSQTISAVTAASDRVNASVGDAAASASAVREALTQHIPDLNRAMAAMSAGADGFSAALTAQRSQVTQAQSLLAGLKTQLASTSSALGALDGDLQTAASGLEGIRTDVSALGAADIWNRLSTISGLDADEIARFMASPVEVAPHVLFPIKAYGSAMAALFTNLSLWIGAFVLMVILRVEVDTEGVEGISVRQAYLGRWLLFAALSIAQAVLVSAGNLVIGVQTANPLAFLGTSVLIGLAYLSIIYALSVVFGIVGKGLCILLVVFQIPGASGLYPIEMMPDFFRGLYPLLPFTYGIDALRETIGGFSGGAYWRHLGALAVFVALAFALGLLLRSRLADFTQLFNRRLAETGVLVSEEVQITGRRRTADIIRALTDGDGFRAENARRARRFAERRPTLLRLTLLVGAAGMAVIGVTAWLLPDAKASMLAVWALWCLLLIAFVVATEYVAHSIDGATQVGAMPDAALQQALAATPDAAIAAPEPEAGPDREAEPHPEPEPIPEPDPIPAPDSGDDMPAASSPEEPGAPKEPEDPKDPDTPETPETPEAPDEEQDQK